MGTRFFRHGELHLALLALLDAEPMHGYQLLGELARRFEPHWRPSPGSIYPAVDALVAEGLLAPDSREGRTVYALTAEGRAALERRADRLAELEARTGVRLRAHDAVDSALRRLLAGLRAAEPQAASEQIVGILERAERELRALVTSQRGT